MAIPPTGEAVTEAEEEENLRTTTDPSIQAGKARPTLRAGLHKSETVRPFCRSSEYPEA